MEVHVSSQTIIIIETRMLYVCVCTYTNYIHTDIPDYTYIHTYLTYTHTSRSTSHVPSPTVLTSTGLSYSALRCCEVGTIAPIPLPRRKKIHRASHSCRAQGWWASQGSTQGLLPPCCTALPDDVCVRRRLPRGHLPTRKEKVKNLVASEA